MHQMFRGAARITALAALAVAVTAVPASAAPNTFDVSPGGAITVINNGAFIMLDWTTHDQIVCQDSSAQGAVNGGTGVDDDNIIQLQSVNFSNCLLDGSFDIEVTALGLPWHFDAAGPVTGTTTEGQLAGIKFEMDISGWACDVVVAGPSTGGSDGSTEANSTDPVGAGDPSKLVLSPLDPSNPYALHGNLVVTDIGTPGSSCPYSIFGEGDPFMLYGTYDVTPGVTISAAP